jgi:hypothetical protein
MKLRPSLLVLLREVGSDLFVRSFDVCGAQPRRENHVG